MKKNDNLTRFGVAMPENLLLKLDSWTEKTGFANRSEALRHLVRDFITHSQWKEGTGVVFGTITLIYDHHKNDVSSELTSLQHDFGDCILCTTHVHLSHELCLEVLVLKGEVQRLKKLEESLISAKGITSVSSSIISV